MSEPLSLETLHGGWPFGPGPDAWRWFIALQPSTDSQPGGLHALCAECGQSMTRLGNWAHTWETLKPQIALHVMQVHADHLTR